MNPHTAASGSSAKSASTTASSASAASDRGHDVEPGVADEHRPGRSGERHEPLRRLDRTPRGGGERAEERAVEDDPGDVVVLGHVPRGKRNVSQSVHGRRPAAVSPRSGTTQRGASGRDSNPGRPFRELTLPCRREPCGCPGPSRCSEARLPSSAVIGVVSSLTPEIRRPVPGRPGRPAAGRVARGPHRRARLRDRADLALALARAPAPARLAARGRRRRRLGDRAPREGARLRGVGDDARAPRGASALAQALHRSGRHRSGTAAARRRSPRRSRRSRARSASR